MRMLLAAVTLSIVVGCVSCGDDDKTTPANSATTPASTGTAAATVARTPAGTTPASGATKTAAPTPPAAGESVEVTGIVGGLNLTGNVIEIRRLQGAAVTQISVDSRTVIRKAAGGTVAFKDIRTSDRIIAKGTLNDRRDTLVASEITVQDVIPGAQPGG